MTRGAQQMKIGNKDIEREKSESFIIAEAGVNHEGNMDTAKLMIEKAAQAGADAIKFQTYKAETLSTRTAPSYWDTRKESTTSQFELFKKFDSFWEDECKELALHCKKWKIHFMSTPFDSESASFLKELMPVYKVASADITNVPLLKQIASYRKPIFISTGASTFQEIKDAIATIENDGNKDIAVLHCVLSYPTQFADANLKRITHLKQEFPSNIIGYSDHTLPDKSMTVLTAAAALGARIIEKHFTLDKTKKGNDHYHAMDPTDLAVFKQNMTILSQILEKDSAEPVEAEKAAIKFARRSVVAKRMIKKGEMILETMLICKRPGTGISPKEMHKLIGRRAKEDIPEDEIIDWGKIE